MQTIPHYVFRHNMVVKARREALIKYFDAEAAARTANYFDIATDGNGRSEYVRLGSESQLYDGTEWEGLKGALLDDIFNYVADKFSFDLYDGWHGGLRVSRYSGMHYQDWRTDYTADDASKLSVKVPLNDSFAGGRFELLNTEIDYARWKVGTGIVYPSFWGHRVQPITHGFRYVLEGWLSGPRFR